MIITEAQDQDLPSIIALQKISLGDSRVLKSEAYFRWKHLQNPFGASKIILAKEGGQLIGLRTFMQWTWVRNQESVQAVRAVDTATDPAHQGKGIFKKLTLQAVDECKAEGVGLVFNSPNPQSIAGYLKMGWQVAGRLAICFGPGSIFPRKFYTEGLTEMADLFPIDAAITRITDPAWRISGGSNWHTPINKAYLHWRFATCPVARYGAIIEPGAFGLVYRVKKLKYFFELRICEAWTEKNDPATLQAARNAYRQLVTTIRPAMVSYCPTPLFMQGEKRPGMLFGPYKKGPLITIRPLAWENLNTFEQFHQWQPSLGSMELF